MSNRKIVVTTKNRGKIEAAENAFSKQADQYGYQYTLVPISVKSNVSDTPLSDEEALNGCMNRLEAARREMPDANMYVALEGGLMQAGDNWYVRGWTLIYDRDLDRMASASGASVQIPDTIAKSISSNGEFTDRVNETYALSNDEASRLRDIGSNGVFSDGKYTRLNTFADGIGICLAYINNERNWQ